MKNAYEERENKKFLINHEWKKLLGRPGHGL
jgi:hypothetical protein